MMNKKFRDILIVVAAAFVIFAAVAVIMLWPAKSDGPVLKQSFENADEIVLTVDDSVAIGNIQPQDISVFEQDDPDIQMHPAQVYAGKQKNTVVLKFQDPLNQAHPHIVNIEGISKAPVSLTVERSYWGYLISILISALLINNYVFTKYLGLCVFFGTSRRKSTATGMGIVFTIVMLVSAILSWLFFKFILVPYHLDFLQVVVFIGLVSLTVQAVDTILRKVNPILFKSFGVFLVLVIANCIIIAVPLDMASNHYNLAETIMLALGAGCGFLLALYLMSNVRERIELAPIPESFKGLPIAFMTAGQFALAFLGFSGLQIF